MDNINLSSLISMMQPELGAIFLLVGYLGKKVYPLLKQNVLLKQSTLDCLMRIEQGIKDGNKENKDAIEDLTSTIKDNMIDLLRKPPLKEVAFNSSGSIVKQGV